MNLARYNPLSGLFAITFVLVSCSTSSHKSPKSDYLMAMDSLRDSVRAKGIPREKVFYQFQLYGISSKRMEGGARGGYTSAWEEWELPDGFRVRAIKYNYVGRDSQITPLKEGDSFFAPGPRLMVNEKYYHEPRLEPYFDEIRLVDRRDHFVSGVEKSRKAPAEQD